MKGLGDGRVNASTRSRTRKLCAYRLRFFEDQDPATID